MKQKALTVLAYTNKVELSKKIKVRLTTSKIDCIITADFKTYIKVLKDKKVIVSIIESNRLADQFVDVDTIYQLLPLTKTYANFIIGTISEEVKSIYNADLFFEKDVMADDLINEIINYYESYKIVNDIQGRVEALTERNDLDIDLQKQLAVKDRKVSSLYTQLLKLQNKTTELFKNWEKLPIPRNLKRVHEFQNEFKALRLEHKQEWEDFQEYFILIHPNFFNKLSSLHSKLTQENLKMCAYIKIGMSNKEIASYLSILPNSVKRQQTRIKNKMELNASQTLRKHIVDIR